MFVLIACICSITLHEGPSILLPLLSKWAWLNLESSALLVIGIVNQFIPRWNGSRSSEDQPALAEHSTCDWVSLDNRHHHFHLNQNNDKDVLIYMCACVFECCVFGSAEQADLSIVAERCVDVWGGPCQFTLPKSNGSLAKYLQQYFTVNLWKPCNILRIAFILSSVG